VIAAGVLTSGFGLVGGDEASDGGGGRGGDGSGQNRERQEPTVAVLNATQDESLGVPGVSGLAEVVANDMVKPAGFKIETRADAPAGEEQSVIMFAPDAEADAEDLAAAVEPDLGPTEVTQMTGEVRAVAEGADLALLVGSDDQGVVGAPAATTAP
jgi:hypothetical protein